MTERRKRLLRRREIRKRNMQKKVFRMILIGLLIALAEILATAFILHCKQSQMVDGIEVLFILIAGSIPAMLWEKVN